VRWPIQQPPPEDDDPNVLPKVRDLVESVEGPIFYRHNQMFIVVNDSEARYLDEGDIVRIGIYFYELLEPARFPDLGKCYLCQKFYPYLTDAQLQELANESS